MTHGTGTPAQSPAALSKTLDNGLRVLKALSRHPRGLTVTELARELGIHRTAVYRLLGTLSRHALVTPTSGNRYQLGLAVIELSGAVRPDIRGLAEAPLRALADETRATAFLTMLDGDDAVSVLVVEPVGTQVHVAYRVGLRHPADRGAAGMAILAGRAQRPGERPEITHGRTRGYVVSQGEIQRGAWGLAAPVVPRTGEAEASVGVVALHPLDESAAAERVTAAAREIGRRLP